MSKQCALFEIVWVNLQVLAYKRAYDRKRHELFDVMMNDEWEARLAANPKLFPQSKFRLHSALPAVAPDGGPTCILRLGYTNYKEFVGTNMSVHAARMQEEGKAAHGDAGAFLVSSSCQQRIDASHHMLHNYAMLLYCFLLTSGIA